MKKILLILGATSLLSLGLSSCKEKTKTNEPVVEKPTVKPEKPEEPKMLGEMLNLFYIPKGMNKFKERQEEITSAMKKAGNESVEVPSDLKGKCISFKTPENAIDEGKTLFKIIGYFLEGDYIVGLTTFDGDLMTKSKDAVLKELKDALGSEDFKEVTFKGKNGTTIPGAKGSNPKLGIKFEFNWELKDENNKKQTVITLYIFDIKAQEKVARRNATALLSL